MYESNSANGDSPPQNERGASPLGSGNATGDRAGTAGGTMRMWVSGLLFLALAVVTFIAGEDNRWVSVPAAILATVALVDVIWVTQRRRRTPPE